MGKFKCKHTGHVYTYEYEHDIHTMRAHPEYEEVISEHVEVVEKPVNNVTEVKVKRNNGRPRKTKE